MYASDAGPNGEGKFFLRDGTPVDLSVPVLGWSLDARWRRSGLETRGSCSPSGTCPRRAPDGLVQRERRAELHRSTSPVATRIRGGYVEAAFDVLRPLGVGHEPAVRALEAYDTRSAVPEGYKANASYGVRELTLGASAPADPGVVASRLPAARPHARVRSDAAQSRPRVHVLSAPDADTAAPFIAQTTPGPSASWSAPASQPLRRCCSRGPAACASSSARRGPAGSLARETVPRPAVRSRLAPAPPGSPRSAALPRGRARSPFLSRPRRGVLVLGERHVPYPPSALDAPRAQPPAPAPPWASGSWRSAAAARPSPAGSTTAPAPATTSASSGSCATASERRPTRRSTGRTPRRSGASRRRSSPRPSRRSGSARRRPLALFRGLPGARRGWRRRGSRAVHLPAGGHLVPHHVPRGAPRRGRRPG